MLELIKANNLIEPFIEALLVEMRLDRYASVCEFHIEVSEAGGWIVDVNASEFLFRLIQATSEQIERAAKKVIMAQPFQIKSHPDGPPLEITSKR